ncbi:MAG: CaiB/BaiF CoA transferase family protein [Porticoccaceae bacterium]
MAPRQMLEGIKVVDFSHVVAGPHCTKILAEHGAEVIKIEPLIGDLTRQLPVHRDGRSAHFIQHNVGKKTMCMDIGTPEGREICHQLIRQADVVVENFSPGVMKKHKLDWDTLKNINPDLIMCSISCFGQDGPLAHLPGYDWIGQSYAGIIDLTGEPDGPPVFGEYAFGDISTGAHAYGAVIAALFHRLRGGGGQHIDISLLEVLFSYHEMNAQVYLSSAGKIVAKRSGSTHGMVAPAGIYKCKDRYIFLLAINHQWDSLMRVIGREDLLADPRFANLMLRGQHKAELGEVIEAWLDSIGDADKAVQILQEHKVPCAPILSIPEVVELPHVKQRGIVRTVIDPVFGEVRFPRTPLRFSLFPDTPDLRAGFLGECNREVLSGWLNYTDDQIDHLEATGVIASKRI